MAGFGAEEFPQDQMTVRLMKWCWCLSAVWNTLVTNSCQLALPVFPELRLRLSLANSPPTQ
ncbi:hypothetical protein JZ751_008301, partial [Albula glossodonta]